MERIRRASRSDPPTEDFVVPIPPTLSPDVAAIAARVIARAKAMGLIDEGVNQPLDRASLLEAVEAYSRAGIGRYAVIESDVAANLRGALNLLNEAVEGSPYPPTEWKAVVGVLGMDLTTQLVGTSQSSVRRYLSQARPTPYEVAVRLHFLALLIADLAGSYNTYGIVRWFRRPRSRLGGAAPVDVLVAEWLPEDDLPSRVATLARSLIALGAS